VYKNTFKEIFNYMKIRNISYLPIHVKKKIHKNSNYHDLWGDKIIKAFHIVFLFVRQLGFDPLTFKPLKGGDFGIFKIKIKGNRLFSEFIRHHLSELVRKSIFIQDLILTYNKMHSNYEKLIKEHGIEASIKLLEAFNELVQTEENITESIIENVMKKHGIEFIYQNIWKDDKDFLNNLDIFNERKKDFHILGLDKFIEEYEIDYPYIYHRFYIKIKYDDLKKLILIVQSELDKRNFSDKLVIDYYFSQIEKMKNYFGFNPYVFKYWFGD
ncbi:MAG: hypothetical protein ACTSO4_17325, partial [Promethearchaeota archaeon]